MANIFEDTMVLENWTEIEECARKRAKVLFPIGVIEEHGPHISLGSDINWSHAMCRKVKAKLKEQGRFDIHAGAFETAVMHYFCKEQVDLDKALTLQSSSLDENGMARWLQGGMAAREAVPLGYAGDPAGYTAVEKHVKELIELQVADICKKIMGED